MNDVQNEIIFKVTDKFSPYLSSDDSLDNMKNILYEVLSEYSISKKSITVSSISKSNQEKLEYFIMSKKISGRSDLSIKQYIRAATSLSNFTNKNFEDISSSDITYFLITKKEKNHWQPTTVKNNILYLSTFYTFLYNEEYIIKNPMKKIEHVKLKKVIKEPFTTDEIKKLKKYASKNIRDITLVEFLLSTGVRVSELVSIKFHDIDFVNNKTKILGKGNKERYVLFTDKTNLYIKEYFEYRLEKENKDYKYLIHRPLFASNKKNHDTNEYEALTTNNVRDILWKISYKSGVSNVYPHKFRRTFATTALRDGMTLEEVRLLLGHESCDTTLIYAKISSDKIEKSYRKVFE